METLPKLKKCTVRIQRLDIARYAEQAIPCQEIQPPIDQIANIDMRMIEPCLMALENNSSKVDGNIASLCDEGKNVAATALLIFSATYLYLKRKRRAATDRSQRKRVRTVWQREWLQKRETEGAYAKLLQELRMGDVGERKLFYDFLRMPNEDFNHLLQLVKPLIEKSDTRFRKAIPAGERLAVTLHYLATGQSFHSLQYVFRLPQTTISQMIPEVLTAIWTVLKDKYVRVSFVGCFQICALCNVHVMISRNILLFF